MLLMKAEMVLIVGRRRFGRSAPGGAGWLSSTVLTVTGRRPVVPVGAMSTAASRPLRAIRASPAGGRDEQVERVGSHFYVLAAYAALLIAQGTFEGAA